VIIIIQRVAHANVSVADTVVGEIEQGILALIGFESGDADKNLNKIIEKLLNYRIFADDEGKMNLSLRQCSGGLLLVPQFTLAANTKKGLRPSFACSMAPQEAQGLFTDFVNVARHSYDNVSTGQFGANMQVSLLNDGPVTFTFNY